jgi:hypothetical protein
MAGRASRWLVVGAIAGAALTSCGSDDDSSATTVAAPVERAAPHAAPEANQAQAFTCKADREALKVALAAYVAINGALSEGDPEAALVEEGFVVEPSALHDIEAGTGVVIVQSPDCGVPGAPVP